ncbi:unnamed protein product, partial [Mesorhabditis belari]|uniref:Glycine N-acyltransferase-like protein n=1 Tax=Mesorhabditis belari TaxID=2138241 RepID=A0AAF3EV53_9BILA
MFRYYSTSEELEEALVELKEIPRLKQFHGSIPIYLSRSIPNLSLHLFSLKEANTKYWIALKSFMCRFHIYTAADGSVDRKVIRRFVVQMLSTGKGLKELCENKDGMIFGDPDSTAEVLSILAQFGVQCKATRPVYIFTYPPIVDAPIFDNLPENFEIDQVRENDIETLISIWAFTAHGAGLQTEAQAKYLPTRVIRTKDTKKLAAFALLEHDGMIVGLNVLPEFRGLKLRDILMSTLAYEAQKTFNIIPFYCCEPNNAVMTKWVSKKHKSLNVNGKQAIILFSVLKIDEEAAEKLGKFTST